MTRHVSVAGIALMLAMTSVAVRAQSIIDTTTASKWYLGVKGGLLISTAWGPDRPDPADNLVESVLETVLAGASAGFSLPIWFSPNFVLEPEVLLSTKGLRWKLLDSNTIQNDTIKWDIKRRYINFDIPVLAKLVLLKNSKRFRPVIYAGPQLSLNVFSYTAKEVNAGASYSSGLWSLADSIPFVDISGVAGLSLQIRAGRGYFIIDARGHAGFLNQGNGLEDDADFPRVIRNLYAVGSVAYCFNPKRRKELW